MVNRYSQPILCTITLPQSDFRLLIACVYEAQHHELAFADRRTDEHLSQLVSEMHRVMTRGNRPA